MFEELEKGTVSPSKPTISPHILLGVIGIIFIFAVGIFTTWISRASVELNMTEAAPRSKLSRATTIAVKAFPTAEGYGADTIGGRGGKIIQVTNLNDSGPGSFREAVMTSGPRIIVFRVGGVIKLESNIVISEPFLTIAGQTAPGDGIVIRNYTVEITASDVIVRNMRFRVADAEDGGDPCCRRALSIGAGANGASRVILDHVSASWGVDQTIDVHRSSDVTIQWSLISESLNKSLHVEDTRQQHAFASLNYSGSRVTYHHNLYAEHRGRVPRFDAQKQADFVNNVIYDWHANDIDGLGGATTVNVVKNYFKMRPGTVAARPITLRDNAKVYLEGNIGPSTTETSDQWQMTQGSPGTGIVPLAATSFRSLTRFVNKPIAEDPAAVAFSRVTSGDSVGATRGTNADGSPKNTRDTTDARVINAVVTDTGKIIDKVFPASTNHPWYGTVCYPTSTQAACQASDLPEGTFPTYQSGPPYPDTDSDGIADSWEFFHGLKHNDATDGNQYASNGYTNIENYINELAGDTTALPPPPMPPTDNSAPSISLQQPATTASVYLTNATTITTAVTASDTNGIGSIAWKNTSGNTSGGTIQKTSTTYEAAIPLVKGKNKITFTAKDPSGNASYASISIYYLDPSDSLDYSISGTHQIGIRRTQTAKTDFSAIMASGKIPPSFSWSVSGLPNTVTAAFTSPNTPLPTGAIGTSNTLSITPSSQAPLGNIPITISVTSGSVVKTFILNANLAL
ncbi:MAG: hypothetical protein AAB372_01860 [Patescibacteria group bacterium]